MNKQKEYLKPRCGIHTIHVKVNNRLPDELSDRLDRCISRPYVSIEKNTGEITTRLVINPNKLTGDDGWCNTYKEFDASLWEILTELNVDSYMTLRVDFTFDYFEDNYNELHKLHKCICLLAMMHSRSSNNYESIDPLTLDHKTTTSRNQYYEVENYNKKIESHGNSQVKNRLELRSKNLAKKGTVYYGVENLIENWINRLGKFEGRYDKLQARSNQYLIWRWNIEKQEGVVKKFYEFIRKYQNNIFTREQLIDLYFRADGERPSEFDKASGSAKNFERSNKLEYIRQKDLHEYLTILKCCMEHYVNSGANDAPSQTEQ